MKKIKIATRKSPLAIWQAKYVKEKLIKAHLDIEIELVSMQTEGDRFLESPLFNVGGKGLFIKELEEALLSNDADIDRKVNVLPPSTSDSRTDLLKILYSSSISTKPTNLVLIFTGVSSSPPAPSTLVQEH